MQHDTGDGDALSSLLSILNSKEPGSPITSVISATTIDLLCILLYPEDYISVVARLSENVENLVDFILHLLRDRRLTSLDATTDFNQRARRLMLKIISTNPVIPQSLIVTECKVPATRDYIGGGAYGGVCKGELCGEIVALKVLYKTGDNVAFCREALTWAILKHEFVLSFLGIYKQQKEMFLVSPYMENGTLAQWRKDAKPSVTETWERILEVAQGMEYIHSEGIVHGDLRGDNVLLDANLHVQIADFGLTRLLDATNTQSGAKHLNFSAPELFGCLEDADDPSAVEPARTQMSDVYAFGCLYYEIYYDSIPFAGRPEGQVIAFVIQNKRPPRQDEPPLSDGAWEVIQQCWVREPWKRPRMKDVIESLITISHSMPLSRSPVTLTSGTTSIPVLMFPGYPDQLPRSPGDDDASVKRRKAGVRFVCTVPGCGSLFTRRFNLKGHMRSHNEEKPFVCHWPGCTKAFSRQHDCKRHEALHSNYRPFLCEGCSKQFVSMDALNRHLRSEGGAECAKVQKLASMNGSSVAGYAE